MNKDRIRAVTLLAPAVFGMIVSIVSALALVPRLRLVEVLTIVGSSFGSGAALAASIMEFRRPPAPVPPRGR
jgi:hypothetical protein